MSKLDPKLEYLLKKKQESQLRRRSLVQPEGEEAESDEPLPEEVKILLKFTGDISELEALGFQSEAVAGNIASGRVSMADLPALAALDSVVKIEISRPLHPKLDVSVPSIKAKSLHTAATPFKGAGVIVGVIDTGIDFTHECFKNADNTSRILYIWDQRPPAGVTGSPPTTYTYGIEYTKADIDAALTQEDPFQVLQQKDKRGHGSHVAGIAAGNGRVKGNCKEAGTFVGVAPEADLMIVKYSGDNDEFGESSNLVDAINYIFVKATILGQPAVINISMGDHIGAHDGTSLAEQFIDGMLSTAGRAVILAAGNEGNQNHHATGTITAGETQTAEVEFRVPTEAPDTIIIDIWYKGSDRFDVSFSAPGEDASDEVAPGNAEDIDLENKNVVMINSQLNDTLNHDNRIYIEIKKGTRRHIEAGKWTLNLHATTLVNGKFHCWIEDETNTAHFLSPYVSHESTIGIPGTGRKVITVGAYADRGLFSEGQLTDFSSHGPTRDGRIKPEIVAPGDSIQSARSSTRAVDVQCLLFCCDKYVTMSGTSVAAPHLAGVVALMLQKNPGLSVNDILTHLIDHTQTTPNMGSLPGILWGTGIVDAEASVAAVPAAANQPASTPQSPASQPSSNPSTSPTANLGGAAPIMPLSLNLLTRLESEILQTPAGQHYAHLVQKHVDEVRTLVNTNKRVGAVWVRGGGPSIVRRLLQALYAPDEPIPDTINGKSVVESLSRFLAVLRRYGSPALRADLDRYEDVLLQFEGLSYNQFLAQLR